MTEQNAESVWRADLIARLENYTKQTSIPDHVPVRVRMGTLREVVEALQIDGSGVDR